ncbi:short-chain dehydrogenase [Hyphomicrobium nitrativorans NL23]|uniref:Short-chain dehydrogenase n=1 Tax=Hyphomicrobium nitrativorans NL23 TaxID=1029756 RepID=V5SE34_9HYPH|nr:NnrS family protein [Hyphomicrobium nitrativorans]AHB48224.1 short-chain dehydrogenase [Hyphomicrobium nitrativorans NL23]
MATIDDTHTSRPLAFLSLGFRPFFLFGALYAALLVALWVPWFLGLIAVPSAFPPVAWHAHELLFGFVPAIIAGFLLTAVPNWTGRAPVAGTGLALLLFVWLLGRISIAFSGHLDPRVTAAVCVAFPLVLAAVIGREIVAARNWRNLKIVAVLCGIAIADALFHYEIFVFGRTKFAHTGALALVLMLVMIVAGRIIPLFTTNWLLQNRAVGGTLPVSFNRGDIVSMLLSGAALAAWVFLPLYDEVTWGIPAAGGMLTAAGIANLWRQVRWAPHRTFAEPLLAILHVAYAFVGIGFVLTGLGVLWDDAGFASAGLHAWTTGALATMMIAVMTRVSRGHTGRRLTAPWPTVVLYVAMLVAVVSRLIVSLAPEHTMVLLPLSGVAWVLAFGGFAILYGPMLARPRVT